MTGSAEELERTAGHSVGQCRKQEGRAAPPAGFSEADLAAGRKLFAADWQFVAAAPAAAVLPANPGHEIAFAGRSNVGKSSLINALTGRKGLARISRTPGRTRELIMFGSQHPIRLVDLPGYGYAAASKVEIASFGRMIADYVTGRTALLRVYLLVDARHGVKATDLPIMDALDRAGTSYQVVLTKADQVGDEALGTSVHALTVSLSRRPAAYPELLITSARSGTGIAELRAAIALLLRERGAPSRRGA